MKIAYLNIYGGRISRGAEVAVHEIAKRLTKFHNVSVFQSGTQKNLPYTIFTFSHIPFISTDVSNNFILRFLKKFYLDPYSLLVLYFSLRCLPTLLKKKYDIIIPVNGFWQIIICKIIRLVQKNKIVVLGYSGIGIDDYINLILKPDSFFTMTKFASQWAQSVNRKIPIKILSGGVNTNFFHPKAQPMKLSLKPPIILTVAALVPYKRIDLTINAVARLNNVSLVVVGNGILKDEIDTMGGKLLPDRFLHLDLEYNCLPSVYTACQLFTLPSIHNKTSLFTRFTRTQPSEAFGIVYLEAMSCGLPIVAPDDELRREIIGKAGIFVNCTKTEEYASAIDKALAIKWGDIPRKQAEKFGWEKIAVKFSADLETICQTN